MTCIDCWPQAHRVGADHQLGWLMVQLLDAERLRMQAIPIDPARTAPTAFTAGAEI